MDKKTIANGLIVLSAIAAVLAGIDYLSSDFAALGLGADSWIAVAATLGVWGVFAKMS
jgi:hypothetical protein